MAVCFTGAVLVFEEELMHTFNKQRYYVSAGKNVLTTDQIIASVAAQIPASKVQSVKWFSRADRSVEVAFVERKAIPKQTDGGGESRKTAFVNPYTGKVLEIYSYRDTFFFTMMSLHRWLLAGEVGKLIVGICTVIFLAILITGLILWWPKSKAILKQRLTMKWQSGFKRFNHDFHVVFGFYSLIFLFVFGFTGLAWSFEWFNKGIYTVTNSSMERPKPPVSVADTNSNIISAEAAFQTALHLWKSAEYYSIILPKDSTDVYTISALNADAVHETASDQLFIDQYAGNILKTNLYKDRNLGQRIRSTFKPVHTGSILGWPGKVVAVITCLFGFSFPITGTIMWWNRTRKKKNGSAMAQ